MEGFGGFQVFASAVLLIFAAAIGKMWLAHLKELKECKDDRGKLQLNVGTLNKDLVSLSLQIGRMEGHLKAIDERHEKAFNGGGTKTTDEPETK